MKKVISILLVALMLMSVCSAGVFAAGDIGTDNSSIKVHTSRSQIPVIRILGDGEPLYDGDPEQNLPPQKLLLPRG